MRAKRCVRTWLAVLLLVTTGVPASVAWAGGLPSTAVPASVRGPSAGVPIRGPSAGVPAPVPEGSVPAVARLWPVGVRPAVLRGWEPPANPYGPGHRGVDLAAAPGDPVRAVAAGRVTFAGRVAGRGVVTVDLTGTGDPPLRTTYEPVRASVREGDEVDPGDVLGALGPPTGHCPGPCLHWGLRRGDAYLNPLSLLPPWLLRAGPSRLLRVEGVPVPQTGLRTMNTSTGSSLSTVNPCRS